MTNTEQLAKARSLTAELLSLLDKMCAEDCACRECELVRQGTARAIHFANNLAYAMMSNLNGCIDRDWSQAREGLATMEKSARTLLSAVGEAKWATRRLETMSWINEGEPETPDKDAEP